MNIIVISLQVLVAMSIFYVWVIRHDNIVVEFKHFNLSDGLRDFVGILKLTFAFMLLYGIKRKPFAVIGSLGIAFFMACAFLVHIRAKSPWLKRIPSLMLLLISLFIAFENYRYLIPEHG